MNKRKPTISCADWIIFWESGENMYLIKIRSCAYQLKIFFSSLLLGSIVLVSTSCASNKTKAATIGEIPEKDLEKVSHENIILGEKVSFFSKTLKESRSYLVHLPKTYNDGTINPKKYPVVYILDGEDHFSCAAGIVDFMGSAGVTNNYQIPEVIVIAIPNKEPAKDNRFRDFSPTKVRDYYEDSGGGIQFLKFLGDELIPHIESKYRTVPLRILAGHSMGGLLTTFDLLSSPSIFNAHIAMDPSLWWDSQLMASIAQKLKGGAIHGSLYLSTYGKAQRKEESREFVKMLANKNPASFRSNFQVFEAERHSSLPLVSLYNGLLFVFGGFRPDLNSFVEHPSAINEHFSKLSKLLGVEILAPEDLIREVCSHTEKDIPDKAIECYQVNVSNYPRSYNALNSLGQIYAAKGMREQAIDAYQRSLNLEPNNNSATAELQKIPAK